MEGKTDGKRSSALQFIHGSFNNPERLLVLNIGLCGPHVYECQCRALPIGFCRCQTVPDPAIPQCARS